jgi:caffeoyl-CoA O-methyltransferase
MKAYAASHPDIPDYVNDLLQPEDPALARVRRTATEAGLPTIAIGPFDGRHLEVIARAANAKTILEIGTLGGYSGTCLARALPPEGHLHTIEVEPRHAEVARRCFDDAGIADRVTVHVGPALEVLPRLEPLGPFDLVFIDADKGAYPDYLAWSEQHLRIGGTLLADNVFRKPRGRPAAEPVHRFNERLATSDRWRTTLLPIEDGLALAVRIR